MRTESEELAAEFIVRMEECQSLIGLIRSRASEQRYMDISGQAAIALAVDAILDEVVEYRRVLGELVP